MGECNGLTVDRSLHVQALRNVMVPVACPLQRQSSVSIGLRTVVIGGVN